ncbi:MAG: hypothetical protein Ta2A_04200 [Treponemataceae bacterium]|nr:MAG: hypothetical protein Ta2A_04200 [Treponemataceae bacterium]
MPVWVTVCLPVVPPVSISADFTLPGNLPITIGGTVLYSQTKWKNAVTLGTGKSYDYTFHDIGFGVRGMYHFVNFVKNWDVYAGPTLGYVIQKFDDGGSNIIDQAVSYFAWTVSIGAHYYFSKNVGAYVELGYGSLPQNASIGLALKF